MPHTDLAPLLNAAERFLIVNDHPQAAALLNQALAQERKHPRANELMGLLLARIRQPAQALSHFEIGCTSPDCSSEALHLYGTLLSQSGKIDKAVKLLKKAVAQAPEHFPAQHDLALVLAQSGRHQEALAAFLRAAEINDRSAELHFNIAHLHELLARPSAALDAYARALQLDPHFASAWSNRADLLAAQGHPAEALEHYERALAIDPRLANTLSNKGNLLAHLRRFDEAIAHYQKAIAAHPGHFVAWSNLGSAYLRLNRLDEAQHAQERALELNPRYSRAWTGKGVVLHDRQQFADALRHFDKAIALDKKDSEARWCKARSELITGNLEQGWINHEHRWCKSPHEQRAYKAISRLSTLKQARGKRVLVWCEQGYGDTLQFSRYLPLLAAQGATITFAVQDGLLRLFSGQFAARIISKAASVDPAEFDLQIPLLSLPLLFGSTLTKLPGQTPYLAAPPALCAAWQTRLDLAADRPNVAIACSGNPEQTEDLRRSMPLATLLPLLSCCRMHVVQKEIRAEDRATLDAHPEIRDLSGAIDDFADTAAILSHMDGVISVDSATAHLAGALNQPVQVMLAHTPDWRWLIDRTDCPWYPSARLCRQTRPGDWAPVIEQVLGTLAKR